MPPSPDKPRPRLSIANVVSPPIQVDVKPDPATLLGLQELNDASLKVQIEKLEAQLDSFRQDVAQRRQYAPRLYVLTCCWLAIVVTILFLNGFSAGSSRHFFSLGDNVLIALLGTTTINVIGLFYVVAKYLFPNNPAEGALSSTTKGP